MNAMRVHSIWMKHKFAGHCNYRHQFGISGTRVWVRHGCKADFIICYQPHGGRAPACRGGKNLTKRFFSHHNRHYNYDIHAAKKVRSMWVKYKHAGDCFRNNQFGFSGKRIWVRRGCKADFVICYQPKSKPTWGPNYGGWYMAFRGSAHNNRSLYGAY